MLETILPYLWFVPVGFIAGAWGTFVGAGGGFLVVPVLAIWNPALGPEHITAISLAVIFFNSFSGSYRYARRRRIDYRAGLAFALATIPGAAIGAATSHLIPRDVFDMLFGVFMCAAALFLVLKPHKLETRPGTEAEDRALVTHRLTDATGHTFTYRFNQKLGVGLSVIVGYLSSLLGIGGGIIHVPVMSRWLHFPVHVATATSHFILTVTSLTAVLVHTYQGEYSGESLSILLALTLGVIPGAQLGAILSEHAKSTWILRGLALVVLIVALRLLTGIGR